MKKLILILAILSAFISNAQTNFVIIYVDASESKSNLDVIQNQIKYLLLDAKDESNIFLYISNNVVNDNGTFSTRSFSTTNAELGIEMMENTYLQRRSINKPDYFVDTKDINSYLLESHCFSDINSSDFRLQNNITFHFFLDEESYEESTEDGKCIINLIAHSNRLVQNGRIIDKCHIFKKISKRTGGSVKSIKVKNL